MRIPLRSTGLLTRDGAEWEEYGHQTMLQTQNPENTYKICTARLQAFAHQLRPKLCSLESELETIAAQHNALHCQLYERLVPVSDATMLSWTRKMRLYAVLLLVVAIASSITQISTFLFSGRNELFSIALGVGIVVILAAAGFFGFDQILTRHEYLQTLVAAVTIGVCFWALLEIGQARGVIFERMFSSTTGSQSFVDDSSAPSSASPTLTASDESSEKNAESNLGSGLWHVTLTADIAIGVLLALIFQIYKNEDYSAWCKLKRLIAYHRDVKTTRIAFLSQVEIAKNRCLEGILRAVHTKTKHSPPYHRHLPILLVVALIAGAGRSAVGQTAKREEVILIDTSQSIARGPSKSGLFHQYLKGVERLLLTEPPDSRVWVSAISTDSFGGVSELLSGWTPSVQGVFTENLDSAHEQLTRSFERKARALSPAATGTDIFGAFWRIKALLDKTDTNDGPAQPVEKTIWLFSDMMNETKDFEMPGLLASGPTKMLEQAKSAGLIVPLAGYEVNVLGASPAGLSPHNWNVLRAFWVAYFHEAGAKMEMYSTECAFKR